MTKKLHEKTIGELRKERITFKDIESPIGMKHTILATTDIELKEWAIAIVKKFESLKNLDSNVDSPLSSR